MTMDIQKFDCDETSSEGKSSSILQSESSRTEQFQVSKNDSPFASHTKAIKRSFDVAFLMLPDEKVRQKQSEKHLRVSKQLFASQEWDSSPHRKCLESNRSYPYLISDSDDRKDTDSPEKNTYDDRLCSNNNISPTFGNELNIDVGTDEYPNKSVYSDSDLSERSRSRPNSNESAVRLPKFFPESPYKHKVYDDPTLIMQSRVRFEQMSKYYLEKSPEIPRSAFTKVASNLTNGNSASPNPSVSPDNLLYQNSISPPLVASSPPANTSRKTPPFKSLLPSNHPLLTPNHSFFKAQQISYHPNTSSPNLLSPVHSTNISYTKNGIPDYPEKSNDANMKHVHFSPTNKLNGFIPFRQELPSYLQANPAYPFSVQNFQPPNGDFMKFSVQPREPINPLIANPAAAILSTLLPPTLAAFSLPAQNVCAKCNISFRMTSDLVYHMRTHHKSEVSNDLNRRKREEKLKCPVCAESFRERHHLTRHMTAHQDKESDLDDSIQTTATAQNYSRGRMKSMYHNNSTLTHK